MTALRSYLLRLVGVVRTVTGNPGLLRAELAYVGFNVAEWATWVSILAYAYQVGGAPATGLAAVVQLVPAALVAPVASLAGDDESADEATVKTFYRETGRIRLQPENSTMEPIRSKDVRVLGRVVGLFRSVR